MVFAAMNYHYLRFQLKTFLDDAASLGFEAVELWAAAPHFHIDQVDGGDVRALRRELNARGLALCCVTPEQCVYPVNLASQDSRLRQSSLGYFKRAIDVASALECPRVMVTPGHGFFDRPREEAWQLCAQSLDELADYAAPAGTELVLECLMPTTSNVLNNSRDIARMLDEVGRGRMAAVLDFNQMAVAGQTVEDYVKDLGPSLSHVHYVDGTPGGHLALGDGTLPLMAYHRQLQAAGFDGTCSLEICDKRYYENPRKALETCLGWLQSHQPAP